MREKHPKHNRFKFKYLLREFKETSQNLAFIGASHPADHEEIKRSYTKSRRDLISFAFKFIK